MLILTRIPGLDVVPLHPDLQQVGSSELASRITWVQANLCVSTCGHARADADMVDVRSLEGLPFPNEEFDFV